MPIPGNMYRTFTKYVILSFSQCHPEGFLSFRTISQAALHTTFVTLRNHRHTLQVTLIKVTCSISVGQFTHISDWDRLQSIRGLAFFYKHSMLGIASLYRLFLHANNKRVDYISLNKSFKSKLLLRIDFLYPDGSRVNHNSFAIQPTSH